MPDARDPEVLIPTRDRPAALAVTQTGPAARSVTGARVVVPAAPAGEDVLERPWTR